MSESEEGEAMVIEQGEAQDAQAAQQVPELHLKVQRLLSEAKASSKKLGLKALVKDGVALTRKLKEIFKPNENDDGTAQLTLQEQGARVAAFKAVMVACRDKKFVGKLAKDAVSLLLDELATLPWEVYGHLAFQALKLCKEDSDHDGLFFCLVPKLLNRVAEAPSVYLGKDHSAKSGASFVAHWVEKACSYPWNSSFLPALLENLRDVNFPAADLNAIITKTTQTFDSLPLDSLPSVMYQLLLLSSKGGQDAIFRGISNHFNFLDEKFSPKDTDGTQSRRNKLDQLRQVEGAILVHITLAMKRNAELGRVYLALIRGGSHVMTPFTVALLFLIGHESHQAKLEEPAFEFLREEVLKSYQISSVKNVPWLEEVEKDNGSQSSVSDSLLHVVEHSRYGWENILLPLLHFSLSLVDVTGSGEASKRCCELGIALLTRLFEVHDSMRKPILLAIIARANSESGSNAAKLLKAIVTKSQRDVLDYASEIKELIEHALLLPITVSAEYIDAVSDVLKLNTGVMDHAILVLRKSLFSREAITRRNSVSGLLRILHELRVENSVREQELGFEILRMLQRGASGQGDLREELYSGLTKTYASNPSLRNIISQLLNEQFKAIFVEDEDEAPIALDKCVEGKTGQAPIKVVEPVHCLIATMGACLQIELETKKNDDDEDAMNVDEEFDAAASLRKNLTAFLVRLVSAELEEFELDKTSEYHLNVRQGEFNQHAACLLLGTYEAMVEFVIASAEVKDRHGTILKLFNHSHRLRTEVKEALKPPTKAGKGGKKGGEEQPQEKGKAADKDNSESPDEPEATHNGSGGGGGRSSSKMIEAFSAPSLISLKASYDLLEVVCQALPANAEDGMKNLKQSSAFARWIIALCNTRLEQFNSNPATVLRFGEKAVRAHVFKAGQLLFADFCKFYQLDKSKETKPLPLICLESFHQSAVYMSSLGQLSHLSKFLAACLKLADCNVDERDSDDDVVELPNDDPSLEANLQIHFGLRALERLLTKMLTASPSHQWSYGGVILAVLEALVEYVPRACLDAHISYFDKLAGHPCQNVTFCKAFAQLFFKVSDMRGALKSLELFARDIRSELGNNHEEDTTRRTAATQLISEKTCEPIAALVIAALARHVDELSVLWTRQALQYRPLKRVKGTDVVEGLHKEDSEQFQLHSKERDLIFHRATMLAMILSELVSTRLRGNTAISLAKLLIQFYKVMSVVFKDVSKLFDLYRSLSLKRFEELVEFIAQKLSVCVFNQMLYLQTSEDAVGGTHAKVVRELRLMPSLVLEMEKFEAEAIRLSKQTDTPIYSNFKRSTARDFRIVSEKLNVVTIADDGKGKEKDGKENQEKQKALKRKEPEEALSIKEEPPKSAKRIRLDKH